MSRRGNVATNRLGNALWLYRIYNNRGGVRDVAKEIGISPATLSRIENGKGFDVATYQKLLAWLLGRYDR